MKCPKCGKNNSSDDEFCAKCGYQLKKEIKKLTAGKVLSWIVGLYFILNGLIMIFSSGKIFIGILQLLASILIIPPTNDILRKNYHFEISGGLKVLIFFVFILVIPFIASYYNVSQPDTSKYDTSITTPQTPKECIELVQYNDRRNEYGWLVISGIVKNKCDYIETGTIHFILYDSEGNVLTSDYTHSDPWKIPPGAEYGFEKAWTDATVYSKVDKFKIWASPD